MGTLYIVATPIGNLEDISARALHTLRDVKKIYAEDTRVIKKLLLHFEITTIVDSYHHHSGDDKRTSILKSLIEGEDIALVTDAGTPGISDPGNELINYLHGYEPDIQIRSIPGASSLTSAISMCGFDMKEFVFLGFIPKKGLTSLKEEIKNRTRAYIYFDSIYRVKKNLVALSDAIGDSKRVFVAREITKMHETHYKGLLTHVVDLLEKEKNLKGEVVVIIEK